MEFNIQFVKKVLIPHKIDEILIPEKLSNGEIKNAIISQLRKRLDLCFEEIQSPILKEYFMDYIEDFSSELWLNISHQNKQVKLLKKQIKKIKQCDSEVDKLNNLIWSLDQDELILYYLLEQQFFIRSWVSEKRKEYKEQPMKEWAKEERSKTEIKRLLNKYNKTINVPINLHSNIFINAKAFLVFDDFQKTISENHLTEYSFIYRVMMKDGLIYNTVRVNTYKKWVNDEFDQSFIKIKTLDSMGIKNKIEKYNTLIEKHKPLSSL